MTTRKKATSPLSTLSPILTAIATANDKATLLRTITTQLLPLLGGDRAHLFVINEEGNYYVDLAAKGQEGNSSNRFVATGQHPYQGSILYWMTKQVEATCAPILFGSNDLKRRFPDDPRWKEMPSSDQKLLAGLLKARGEIVGLFCLDALEDNNLAEIDTLLFQTISDQLAAALSNLLLKEQLVAEQQFKETLLSINEAVASASDRKQLLRTIYQRIKPIFAYDSYGLFVLSEDQQYHYELIDAEAMGNDAARRAIEEKFGAHDRYPHAGSVVEAWMDQGPGFFLLKDYIEHPQALLLWEAGLRQLVAGPLTYRREVIGMLCFSSRQEDFYSDAHLPLFAAISEQLSMAVTNVLVSERVLAEKATVEKLRIVSKVMATIQHRSQLQDAFDRVRKVLPFDRAGLFVLTPNGQQHYELLDTYGSGGEITPACIEARFGGYAHYTHANSPIAHMMHADSVALYDVNDLSERFPDHPQHTAARSAGIQQMMAAPLRQGERVIGLLTFSSKQADQYHPADFTLFQSIAELMSTVVSHVVPNEREREERHFKETILSISEASTRIRDREDLYQTVMEKVHPITLYDDAVVAILSEDQSHSKHVLTMSPVQRKAHPLCQEIMNNFVPVEGGPFEDFLAQDDIAQYSLEDWLQRYPNHVGVRLMREIGLNDSIVLKLRSGGEVFAFLLFHFKKARLLRERDKPLYINIADQLAVAVSNVLANERLLEEKHYKETLLGISEAATQIRDRDDLYHTIMQKVYPIVRHDNAVVLRLSEDHSYVEHILTMSIIKQAEYPLYHEVVSQPLPVADGPLEEILAQPGVAQNRVKDLLLRYPTYPGLLLLRNIGLTDTVALKLYNGGELFGLLMLYFKEVQTIREQDTPLYLSIADQLAVAVSNVLANEKLLEEKQFKETLLDISEAATRVRDREGLLKIIQEKIHPIIPYADASVATFSEDYTLMSNILVLSAAERMSHPSYHEAVNEPLVVEQGMPKEYLDQKDVSHHSLEEMLSYWPDSPSLRLMQDTGLVDSVILRLRSGDKVFGLLTFHFTTLQTLSEPDELLYLSVADQLAVAVSNVLANERIQEREREKALLLSVINALNQGQDWKDKLRRASRQLRTHIPFTQISFGASQYSESFPNYGFEQIGPDEYRTLDLADFFKMSDMTPETMAAALSQRTYQQTTIVDTATFRRGTEENALEKAIWEVFGTRSFMVVPITLKEDEGMYVVFYSRQEDFYQEEHRQLLDNIRSSFGLALEKHLNYEKIAQLNARLTQEKTYLEEEIKTHYNFDQIIGKSPAMQKMFLAINQVAFTDSTVLLQGETGTGKELAARALHKNSPRSKQSLIKVNCASLPPQLIESELFGHEKGAFTGAVQRRIGKFELANSSTIFLDEIGELPLEVQSKLLRVLQEKEFERLGSNQVRRVNARIVAATNRDLSEEVQQGRFRRDLYFRLNVFPIQLPPLRERGEDIALLAHFFVEKYTTKYKKRLIPLDKSQLQELFDYAWPGNVRELEHLLERAVIQADNRISALNLPTSSPPTIHSLPTGTGRDYAPKSWKDTEVEMIINTLRYCKGKVRGEGGAAQLLELHPNTLESRMKKLGIKRQHIITE